MSNNTSHQSNHTNNQEPLLRWFRTSHLNTDASVVGDKFAELAHWIADNVPRSPERTVALRKLLESKDAGVRAGIETRIFQEEEK